jgi:hypothetical protein
VAVKGIATASATATGAIHLGLMLIDFSWTPCDLSFIICAIS